MASHGKELSEDLKRRIAALHEDGQGDKKIANTLKLSCSTVAKIIQRFKRAGSTQNWPRVGHPKKLSARAEHHIQMPSLKDWHWSAVSIAAEIKEVGGQSVNAQTIRRTLYQIGVYGCHPRKSLFWRRYTRKPANTLSKTCQQSTWITGTMSYGLMRWRLICLVPMALLKRLGVKMMDWQSMSPDLNPIDNLWGILKWKVEVRKVSNICQLRDVVMEKWKSTPVATCEALVNAMPRKVKAVLNKDAGNTKYWQLTLCMLILTTFPKRCTHFCWQGFSF